MPSRFTAQSGKGAILVALALVATLLVPSMYTWAVKGAAKPGVVPSGLQDERDIDKAALNYFQRNAVPDRERPLNLSPLGNFTPYEPPLGKRKGWVETQVGFFNPKDAKSFDALPSDLRPMVAHAAPNGKGLGVGTSTSIIQISEAALKDKGFNAIDARIRELGLAVVETHQDRALTVHGNDKAMTALMAEPFVETATPYAPAFKLEPATGRQQLLDKTRASKMQMDVHIRTWDKSGVDSVLKDLKANHSDTVSLLEDGLTIRATLDKNELKQVLRNDAVSMVREIPEYTLQANFVLAQDPPVIQVGEAEHTGAATPYWDAGVDGGGCGYCSNAFGTACTSNAGCAAPGTCVHASATQCTSSVPAVIVAILDNGASTDAATLAHSTATLTEAAISGLIAGNNHRKIRAYQVLGGDVGALGTTCDNVLSGGQTHGNVVAGIIAGNASALGFTFQKNSNAASFGDVRRINLDGSARGARLHIQDAGPASTCPVAELTERGLVTGLAGTLITRMDDAYATGTRLHVMPFGIPTWIANGSPTAAVGTYTADSSDIDKYLLNNLEYQVFVPVGNKGQSLTNGRDLIPDFFDGEASATSDPGSSNPGVTLPLQTSPPATAKNGVSAGATCTDTFTMFGAFNEEENVTNYTAKGPATSASLRTAPILVGVGNDRTPTGGGPAPFGMYTVKSKDNNQDGPVEAEIDEQARGTSFGTASIAAAATLMQDYFHQGFYPTGDRVQGDRVPVLSGATVKALLAASANFTEQLIGLNASSRGMDGLDVQVATTRGSVVTISGTPRVLGNNQQGYGRPIVSQVLPLVNWANVGIPPDGAITQDTIEKPGLGLLVWEHGVDPDGAGPDTALPVFSGATIDHHFTVLSNQGEIRACMAYPDPPGNLLVNDLDLELISPTGTIYDGNVYNPSNQVTGQWGLGRTGAPDFGDIFNPIECVHLHDNPDGNPATNDDQIVPGTWTLRVKQGAGGAVPGAISQINGPNEDANGNNRLDAGEDLDADGLLDKGGVSFSAVVSGPLVATKDGSNPAYWSDYPQSIARLDKIRYTCSDDASVVIMDGDADRNALVSAVTARVFDASGVQVDSESNIEFGGSNSTYTSGAIPVRFGTTGTPDNGVLEGDTGYTIEVTYADTTANSRTAFARAPMNCDPNFIGGVFGNPGERNKQDLVFGGCDNDQFFDKNEVVTYSVAVVNNDLFDQYTDVTATLRACAVAFVNGTCATPSTVLTVLDSPKNIGRLPVGQPEAVSFTVQVSSTPQAQGPRVFLRVDLSETGAAKDLSRLNFEFVHAMGADRQSLHYSTDYPNGSGGTITRDLNRSLVIEPNDRPGLTLGLLDETISFDSLFFTDPSTGRINNQIQAGDEAYPALGIFTAGTNGDGTLDRHVLVDGSPAGTDMIPWNFDANNGGWYTARDSATVLGTSPATLPVWHWVNNGTCGFQSQSKTNCVLGNGVPGNDPDGPGGAPCAALTAGAFVGGVWHTGNGVAGTCTVGGAACYLNSDCAGGANGPCVGGADNPSCGNFGLAFNAGTSLRAEYLHDYLVSPIIEKVNQGLDANNFPFTVEFQRLAFNDTVQIDYADNTLYINVDNNVDSNNNNSIIKPGVFRGDGFAYYVTAITGPIDPYYTQIHYNQTTFGPLSDPDGSLSGGTPALTGDESGFSGFDQASPNPYAVKPIIPQAPINLRPFPGGNEVHVGGDDVAGPSRTLELDLVGYEDVIQFFTPGDAGNRFQIGLSFLDVEQAGGSARGDFGFSIDDVVFEWDEVHPVTEATAACDRIGIGGPNEIAAGCRCSTLSVDRTNLYDCNETVAVVVNDPRYASGATCSPTGNAGAPDVIQINAWSNSEPFPGEVINLTETGNATGVFKGNVPVSGIFNSPGTVFTVPGQETNLFFAYEDSTCDSNENHKAGQSDFDNLDGDGIQAASGRDGICGTDDDIPALFGADGLCGFNPSTGAIDDLGDNCALVYNNAQVDADGDKVGGNDTATGVYFGCDNCPLKYNPDQADGDLDGVGDACDYDDVDNDGVINSVDNCPDWPNPGQQVSNGAPPRGEDCDGDGAGAEPPDDGDGIPTVSDNCLSVSNAGQADTDGPAGGFVQPLGDACDGDCVGTCVAGVNAGKRCNLNPDCPGSTCGTRTCSTVDDDADVDFITDNLDNCPVTNNPTILPGSDPPVQSDDNFNGIGNACDPAGSFDENLDGLPDDVANGPFFAMAASCKNVPLANVVLLSPIVRDRAELKTCTGGPTVQACNTGSPRVGRACTVNADCGAGGVCGAAAANSCGDGDSFGDPGERVRIALFLQNISGFNLTGINLSLSTADPDIQCILDANIAIASFPNNSTVNTASLSPGDDPSNPSDGRFFEIVISPTTQTVNAAAAARANMTMTLNSNEAGGTASPVAITTLLDLDIPPGASPTYVTPTRCDGEVAGVPTNQAGNVCVTDADCSNAVGSCRGGILFESFETPGPSPTGTGGVSQNNDFSQTIGYIERNAAGDSDTTMVGRACFGFIEVLGRTAPSGCEIDPDFQTDWHFEVVGAVPNGKAFRGTKSAHFGRHTDATQRSGDTTPHREIEAFETNPVNLTITPAPTDLFLSFWHIAAFLDDNAVNFQTGQGSDRADVQIAVDTDPTAADDFGRWQKLTPFQNVYEHTTQVFSWFGYCEFTATDGAKSSNPTVYGETMCFPDGIWSHSGNVLGINTLAIFGAQSGGTLGSVGDGIWVQSKFNLGLFIGQRVKIRWIASIWEFGIGWNSYLEPPAGQPPFDTATSDDGWWLDAIHLSGAVTAPSAPIVDPTTIPLSTQCPASAAANCNEAAGSHGFTLNFTVDDTNQDGVISPGEQITLDASQTLNPGGCADGVPQFRFSRVNGGTTVIQDWSTAGSIQLSNEATGDNYQVEVRCSSDFSCTTLPGDPGATPPLGSAACVPVGLRLADPPVAPCTGQNSVAGECNPGFTTWTFGSAACGPLGAPGALICGATMNWEAQHDPDGVPAGQVCHARVPATWGNSFITTGALPNVSATDAGLTPTTVWGPMAAGSFSANVALGGGFAPNTCDISPGGVVLAVPVGPLPTSFVVGDTAAPAVGTVTYYLAGFHTLTTGAACTGPFAPALPATNGNIDYAGATDCYRWDDDVSVGGAYAPVLSPACP